jgi:ATP-dependent Clp protease adaptor protein ClpS
MHAITLGLDPGGSIMSTTIESTPTRKPNPTKPRPLPQWKVLVHNDDVNTYEHVIRSFMDILRMEVTAAMVKTTEVDRTGAAVVCVTHREHAELIQGQLHSKSLTASIEPDA